jgi:putative ATPase
MVSCPVCGKVVKQSNINAHLDSDCTDYVEAEDASSQAGGSSQATSSVSSFFQTPLAKRTPSRNVQRTAPEPAFIATSRTGPSKRPLEQTNIQADSHTNTHTSESKNQQAHEVQSEVTVEPEAKRQKQLNAFQKAAPLADRMRPKTLDEICGQELVGPSGVLRGLIEQDRVPSMILWGSAGTGKTTIARVIADIVGSRFIEINSTSSGVAECKKIFAEARSELGLTGRKTIIFCDEIHRSVSAPPPFLPRSGRDY